MMVPGDYGNRVDSPGIMHQQATSFWKFLISMYTQRTLITNALTIQAARRSKGGVTKMMTDEAQARPPRIDLVLGGRPSGD